ncbi:hypothetical protein BEP19_15330 [Ammoniphilus oxalaticus]|uniref:DUF4871 domain-containing protein n=1 Tax=Ammoniphilus oxalaticus TaxID=66863 RepID=A0A419SD53_9BACL|nr:DUF4871 domain-containing protein [Ammoniphilus oxalaticus]RKD21049.1 hypothetical protein BEP19_15330 [Ammoniphilus oxalaticus]
MKSLLTSLFALVLLLTGCVNQDKPPADEIVWEESPTFQSNGVVMRGIPDRLAIIDTPLKAGEEQDFSWHFWGHLDEVTGKLTVMAEQQDVKKTVVLIQKVYILPAAPSNGADNHFPSMLSLPSPGLWKISVYIKDRYFDSIFVEVN